MDGAFCPRKFVASRATSRARLAAITGGGTVIANAVSGADAAAAAEACAHSGGAAPPAAAEAAPSSDCAALPCSHHTYGLAAMTKVVAAGLSHGPVVNVEITDPKPAAAECNWSASSPQPAEAATREPEPGPVYIRPELISGGNSP